MSDLAIIIGGVVLAILGLFGFGAARQRKGRQEAERDAMQDAYQREQAGREAVHDGRASGGSPDDRVRDNDARW